MDDFLNNLVGDIDECLIDYLLELSSEKYRSKYTETWSHGTEGINSLKRGENIPLLFDFIDEEVNRE